MTDQPDDRPSRPMPGSLNTTSPDELMSDFRGHSLVKIVVFTVVVHVFVLAIFSPGYIKAQLFGESEEPAEEVAELSDEEKLEKAQKDGKAALREIADRYDMTINELKAQLDAEPAAAPVADEPTDPAAADADEPASAIERELDVEVDGPEVPDLSAEDEEDLFAPDN